MKKLLFIFNPHSGKARIRTRLFEIIDGYTRAGYLVTVYPTQRAGDGTEYLSRLRQSYDLIVCSGGDGTLNEVVSGLAKSGRKVPLGYIPSGSTNDFGHSLGIPQNVSAALDVTVNGRRMDVDIGLFDEKYFVYVAAFGIFTDVSYTTPQDMKNTLGYLAYVLQGIGELSELKTHHMKLSWDDGEAEDDFIVGMVLNSFSVAGFKSPVSCDTKLDDGIFEVLLIRCPENILELNDLISSLLVEKIDPRYILYIRTARLRFESEPMDWTLDGEFGGRYERAEIVNCCRALPMMVKNNRDSDKQ